MWSHPSPDSKAYRPLSTWQAADCTRHKLPGGRDAPYEYRTFLPLTHHLLSWRRRQWPSSREVARGLQVWSLLTGWGKGEGCKVLGDLGTVYSVNLPETATMHMQ